MIKNQRPYQWMYSKTGNAPLSSLVAVGAKLCGVLCYAAQAPFLRKKEAIPDADAARRVVEAIHETPPAQPLAFPPLPAADGAVDVSVVIPAYNAASYVAACIDSVLAQQTTRRIQIIVVNDGSTDGTGAVLQAYAARPEVTVVTLTDGGSAAKARNAGLLHATGRYLMFVDSDDVLLPAAVERLVTAAEATGADVVQGGWQYIDENDHRGSVQRYVETVYEGARRADRLDLPGMPWGKLYRRALFETVRFPSYYPCFEDAIIHFLVFRQAKRVAAVADTVYLWRKNSGGITATSQNRPVAVLSCAIVEQLLLWDAALGLPHDELFWRSLVMQLSNFCYANVAGLPYEQRRQVFRRCCVLYAQQAGEEIPRGLPFVMKQEAKALRSRRFGRWERLGRLFQLIR